MDHFPTSWGRPRNDAIDAFNTYPLHQRPHHAPKQDVFADGVQHTQQPIVTGTSILAFHYKDGIMMAADTLASYGSLARFKSIQRLHAVGSRTIIGASGDMSDFQYIQTQLDQVSIDEFTASDGHELGPAEVHEYLSRTMFLAYVDLLGTTYSATTIATGFGAHIAIPLLRSAVEGKENDLTEEQAREIMTTALRVLFYRDARSLDKYQIATVTDAGVNISEPLKLETSWSFAEGIRGYGSQTQ
ncbi:Proteasome subunit beta type-7 [Steccherinum ochraceum]|uniref:Proteasome subunit beta n=1 Tax=Steccherinum ochraceum TaxID=92696 RepID=A0A4R0RID2_9APHY|nr:Proteasome subunit beta type-7 [Steccherinum ochraceum]